MAQVLEVEARMGKRTDQMQPACAPVSSLRNGMPRLQPRRRRGSRARMVRMVRKVLAHGEAVALLPRLLLLLLAVPEVTREMGIVDSHHNHDHDHRAMGKGSNSSSVATPRRRRVTFHTWCAETAIRQMMWTGGRTKRMTRMGRRKTSMYSSVCMCVC